MPDGEMARWRSIKAAPSPLSGFGGELGRRIQEMGLVPGTEITVKQRAPLSYPVALRVMGGTLTLRNRRLITSQSEPSPA